jgi:RNA polymerase sigma factor (TIGR02999 family)
MGLVYDELRSLAHHQMAGVPASDTLQPTALVHEAYLRLVGREAPIEWEGRAHFFNAAARAMRDIIVDQARKHGSRKRGGDRVRVTLDEQVIAPATQSEDLLALDEALHDLEQADRSGADIVMLRYFAGLSIEDTARAIQMPPATLKRRWRYARAWLHRRMYGSDPHQEESADGA